MKKSLSLAVCLVTGAFAATTYAAPSADLQPVLAKLAAAKAGEVVKLPAGTFTTDEIVVPAGVTLSGAGYDKTILMATGTYGLTVRNAAGAQITDLSVRGAKGTDIVVDKSSDVTLARLGIEQALTGLMVTDSSKVRAENLILADNRTGAVVNGTSDSSFVNSTFDDNNAISLSLGVNKNTAVFNNLFLNSPLGVFVAPANDSLMLDYNIYQVSKVGKSEDAPPDSVFTWRDQTGYDAHSMQQTVEFAPGAEYVYQPANVMPWSPDRVVTAGWGTSVLGAFAAPKLDIDGKPATSYGPGVGAWEVPLIATRPADGKFTVQGDEGTTSAGIYTKEGRLLTWLFNNLPLKKGTYSFWVPPRDLYGQPIVAGDYELRTAQANLRFVPVGNGFAGNTGPGPKIDTLAQIANAQAVYDENGQVLIGLGWNEGGINFRSMTPDFKSQNWSLPGASAHVGVATDGKGFAYSMRNADPNLVMLKIDQKTGHTVEILPGQFNHLVPITTFSQLIGGMAILGDSLYLADTGANKLFITPLSKLDFANSVPLPSPSSPSADVKRGLIWLLSGANIVAVDPAGAKKFEIPSPVAGATSLSVRGDRLALLDEGTGIIHLFDISADPTKPVAKGQIVTEAKAPAKVAEAPGLKTQLSRIALNDDGDVVVRLAHGVSVFGSDGKMKGDFTGGWYNSFHIGPVQPDNTVTIYDPSVGDTRVKFDLTNKTWKFIGNDDRSGTMDTGFNLNGKAYLLSYGYTQASPAGVTPADPAYVFCTIGRVESQDKVTPLLAFLNNGGTIYTTKDLTTPLTGKFDPARWTPLLDAAGQPVTTWNGTVFRADTNGDLIVDVGMTLHRYSLTGFDANGIPQYDWNKKVTTLDASGANGAPFQSPYTFKATPPTAPFGMAPNRVTSFFPDGGITRLVAADGGQLAGLTGNWGGTDIASFGKDGKMLWFQPLTQVHSVSGPYVVNDIVYGNGIITSETQVFSKDGLYLGRLGQPKGIPWGGKWLDNSLQFHPFAGTDGKQYVLYGDFNENCLFWFEVAGLDKVIYQKQPLVISPALATALAALPQPAAPQLPAPPTTKITIKKLSAPMPIDGDMEKWRKELPVPQVIITPDTGSSAAISGPADFSSVVRFGYEGTNLYVQVITFDDIITHFQDAILFYKQDAVEMAINSFGTGFKFGISHTRDKGDIFLRERFGIANLTKFLDPAAAPRKITILDNAENVPERKLIEALYNVDLSKCKVIVTEFKLPLDASGAYEGAEKDAPSVKSGDSIRIGLMIDDNDVPGGDVQDFEVFPATYNTFSGPETGALATFE